jgi:hypothetical protein
MTLNFALGSALALQLIEIRSCGFRSTSADFDFAASLGAVSIRLENSDWSYEF